MTVERSSDRPVVVVGAGVIGISTAIVMQRLLRDPRRVTILAAELPYPKPMPQTSAGETKQAPSVDYASMWAGAHYRPIPFIVPSSKEYNNLTPTKQLLHAQLAQEHDWAVFTAGIMKKLATSNPEAGVEIVQAVEHLENPPAENMALKSGDVYASPDDGFRVFDALELERINREQLQSSSVKWGCEYETYVVNVHQYCTWLLQRFVEQGGKVVRHRLSSFKDGLALVNTNSGHDAAPPLFVNCSGRSQDLAVDPKTKMIRGQTVLVKQQYHSTKTRQCADGVWSFIIPRPLGGGTIIGGTKQIGDCETQPRLHERQQLLDNAVKYYPDFVNDVKEFEVVQDNVGRRPWREGGMRVEIDHDSGERSRVDIVHGYGAGGRGYEISWGVAEQICSLASMCLDRETKL